MTSAPPDALRRRLLAALPLGLAAPATGLAQNAAWPQRPLTLVVPFGPGGVADLTARSVGQALAARLGQPVVVDNRPGAGGIVATQAVLSAPADGHTWLLMSNASAVSVHLVKKLPFDVRKDLAPVSTLGFFDLALAVPATSRFKSLKDLLAYAKAAPGRLSIATIALGSTQHLSAELFKARAGIDALVVPYKATPAVITALRSGEVDVAVEVLSPLLPQIQGGALRALAVTGTQRSALLPEVPTVQEQGVPNYSVASWNALAVRAGTPPVVIAQLQRAVQDAVNQAAVRSSLQALGVRPQAGTPAELATLLADEIQHWGAVVKAAKIEAE
jgi:tripartite-type tricarboxylate transporter receptor subunit TctC